MVDLQIMNFGQQQKGLFTFYIEQTQPQLVRNYSKDTDATLKKSKNRDKRRSQFICMPTMAQKTLKKQKTRSKMYYKHQNPKENEQFSKSMDKQVKQKNIFCFINQSQSAKPHYKEETIKYKKMSDQLSNIYNLKAHLEELKTKKRIASQKSIQIQQLGSLSMNKKYSQQDLRKTKFNYKCSKIKLEYEIDRNCNLQRKPSINELKKKTILTNKSKKGLNSKMRQICKQKSTLPLIQQKENKQFLRYSHQNPTKKLYKKYKRVNNPLKKCDEPFLQPIKSHRIRQFKEYLVNIQQISRQLQGNRPLGKARYSQNYTTFTAQKEIDCLQLLSQLKQIKY